MPGLCRAEEPVQRIEVVIDGTEAGLQGWISDFRPRALAAGVSTATFETAMAGVHFLPQVIEKDQRQDEFTKTIWDYLDKAVSDDRITVVENGVTVVENRTMENLREPGMPVDVTRTTAPTDFVPATGNRQENCLGAGCDNQPLNQGQPGNRNSNAMDGTTR